MKSYGCLRLYCYGLCYKREKTQRYKRMLSESNLKIKKQLDIQQSMQDQMFIKTAFSVLLSAKQSKIVKHLSLLSLNLSQSTSEPQLPQNQLENSIKTAEPNKWFVQVSDELQASKDVVDRRLYETILGKTGLTIAAIN